MRTILTPYGGWPGKRSHGMPSCRRRGVRPSPYYGSMSVPGVGVVSSSKVAQFSNRPGWPVGSFPAAGVVLGHVRRVPVAALPARPRSPMGSSRPDLPDEA